MQKTEYRSVSLTMDQSKIKMDRITGIKMEKINLMGDKLRKTPENMVISKGFLNRASKACEIVLELTN